MEYSKLHFTEAEREAVYRAIFERRDVRSGFLMDAIDDDVLKRVLTAAHHAPSVGFMQPWDFLVISSNEIKSQVKEMFNKANTEASLNYSGERKKLYKSLKLEGIMETPINICITCDRSRGGTHVLGRNSIVDTDIFSVCLAVQNFWLAARAEGLGVGWVSIIDPVKLKDLLKLPESVFPIAYLCVGYVNSFKKNPDLEVAGWESRIEIEKLLHKDTWGTPYIDSNLKNISKKTKLKKKKPALMLQGTASSVGKTLLTAAFCRILHQDGFKVAPFKAQNMSNNSWVTLNGDEIARSQVNQAQAAKIEPDYRMNPILLKPLGEISSQVVLCGKAVGSYDFKSYGKYHDEYFSKVCSCYDSLEDEFDVIVLEGAGSSAEVNLKDRDLVNMKMAHYANASTYIVGDIDRGGVFASFVGMMATFKEWERNLVSGYIVNRFRGDKSLLEDAYTYMEHNTGKPVVGVIPLIKDLKIPEEDGVQFSENSFDDKSPLGERIDVAVIGLDFVSNFNDVDPIRFEKDVRVRIVRNSYDLGSPDVVVIPGSRNVFKEIKMLNESGLGNAINNLAKNLKTEIIGICGGLQILGDKICDPHGIESKNESISGLKLLNLVTEFQKEKSLTREEALHLNSKLKVKGYRIHHGFTVKSNSEPIVVGEGDKVIGYKNTNSLIWGTYLHGIFDDDTFRRWFIDNVRERKGLSRLGTSSYIYSLDSEFDRVADFVRESLDIDKIYKSLNI